MNLFIRPVRLSDAEDINEMRRQKDVRANTLALITETIDSTEGFLKVMGGDDHILITEIEGNAVGMVGIHLLKKSGRHILSFLGFW